MGTYWDDFLGVNEHQRLWQAAQHRFTERLFWICLEQGYSASDAKGV